MKSKVVLAMLIASLILPFMADAKGADVNFNRAPLTQRAYAELPLGTIQAKGWLYEMLDRQRDGLTGRLDEFYPQVMGKRNGWLGGDGDVWERGPYWIDGLLPLAYILDDKALKAKVQPWIEWALASQDEEGYFGPKQEYPHEEGLQRNLARDWWPKMVMLKVLQQYYSATGDKRVIECMTKYFRYQLKTLPSKPLNHWSYWGKERGGDNLLMVYWLYNITGDEFLLELGDLIYRQTVDWASIFGLREDDLYRQHSRHTVNLAHGFKTPAVYYQRTGDRSLVEDLHRGEKAIRSTIGYPTGLWGGDESIRFGNPVFGSELCTAVEMLYSLENVLQITGESHWGDYVERVAFNALPTQSDDNYTVRQYYQQLNQVEVSKREREFSTPYAGSEQLFGLLTGYPCCTSNMHQGWPKFTQNLWYATPDNGLAAMVYAPSSVECEVNGRKVKIVESTNYPFEESVIFEITIAGGRSHAFPLRLRLPEWSKGVKLSVNGVAEDVTPEGGVLLLNRKWNSGDKVEITFEAEVVISRWYDRGIAVERGPLLYGLKMEEKWVRKEFPEHLHRRFGREYYEVYSTTPWNWGFVREDVKKENLSKTFIFERKGTVSTYPWNVESAPMAIKAKVHEMTNWRAYNGSVGPINYRMRNGDIDDMSCEESFVELIPYGCTTLRIALFPERKTPIRR